MMEFAQLGRSAHYRKNWFIPSSVSPVQCFNPKMLCLFCNCEAVFGYIGQIVRPPLTPAKPLARALTKKKKQKSLNQVKSRFCSF